MFSLHAWCHVCLPAPTAGSLSFCPSLSWQAFAGGCAHGWWHGASLAAKFPPHQRSIVRVRAGASRGLRFATFALIFER